MSVPSETLDGMDIETVPSLVSLALALGAEDAGDLGVVEPGMELEGDQLAVDAHANAVDPTEAEGFVDDLGPGQGPLAG